MGEARMGMVPAADGESSGPAAAEVVAASDTDRFQVMGERLGSGGGAPDSEGGGAGAADSESERRCKALGAGFA